MGWGRRRSRRRKGPGLPKLYKQPAAVAMVHLPLGFSEEHMIYFFQMKDSLLNQGMKVYCTYCEQRLLIANGRYPTKDHVNPVRLGGGPKVNCCSICNEKKGGMSISEWVAYLDHTWRRR